MGRVCADRTATGCYDNPIHKSNQHSMNKCARRAVSFSRYTRAGFERLDDGAPVLFADWPVARHHHKGGDGTIFVTTEDETVDA